MSGILFLPFGATSVLPFPTIFKGHRQLRVAVINPKTQVAENQVLFPLVSQWLTFYDKFRKKEEHPWTESSLRHQLTSEQATGSSIIGTRLLTSMGPFFNPGRCRGWGG